MVQTLGWSRLMVKQIYFSPVTFLLLVIISVVEQPPLGYQFCQPEKSCMTLTPRRYGKQRNQEVISGFSLLSKRCCFL